MVAIPSGTPIPTPSAVGRVAERSSVWADAARSVDLLAGEDEVTPVDTAEPSGPADNVVVARLVGAVV